MPLQREPPTGVQPREALSLWCALWLAGSLVRPAKGNKRLWMSEYPFPTHSDLATDRLTDQSFCAYHLCMTHHIDQRFPIRCTLCGVREWLTLRDLPYFSGGHAWRCAYCSPTDLPELCTAIVSGPTPSRPVNLCAWCDRVLSRFSEDDVCRPCLRSAPASVVTGMMKAGMLPKYEPKGSFRISDPIR